MGKVRIVNPMTKQTVLEENDDGIMTIISEDLKKALQEAAISGRVPDMEELRDLIRQVEATEEQSEKARVIPYRSGPVLESDVWNGNAARERLAQWASSDGSGDKSKVDFGKYEQAFLIQDGPQDAFSSYKYPHHDIEKGKLYIHSKGVTAAMAFLLKIRPDGLNAGYRHLSRHYRDDLKKDPPPLKKEAYTNEEMVQHFGENWRHLITLALE